MSTILLMVSLWASGAVASGPPAGAAPPTRSVFEAPWRWTTEQGQEVTLARWRGQTLILAPFYTSCRTRCPATIAKLRSIEAAYRHEEKEAKEGKQGKAGAKATEKPAAIVLVTLDPATDSAAHLLAFKKSAKLPDAWTLLRGGAEDTRSLARWLEARPAYDDGHIDHQVRIAVFDGDGRLVRNLHGWDFPTADAVIR